MEPYHPNPATNRESAVAGGDGAEYPSFGEDWRKRWVQMGNSDTLHRVASVVTPSEEQWQELRQHYKAWRLRFKREGLDDWDADGLSPRGIRGETACGQKGRLGMPGIFSRMGAPRCKRCCRKASIPDGHGAPFNDEGLGERQKNA